ILDRVWYESGVAALVLGVLPDQLFEEHAARRDPAMVASGGGSVAVTERAVMHDDPADAAARPRREVCGVATFEVNDRRHDAPPPTTSATITVVFPVPSGYEGLTTLQEAI